MRPLYHKLRRLYHLIIVPRIKILRSAERERLSRLYRFAEFGKLSAGLFHDLANPLTALTLSVSKLTAKSKSKAEALRSAKAALAASRRVEEFMHILRKQLKAGEEVVRFSANHEIEDAIEVFQGKARNLKVAIVFEAEEEIFLTQNIFKWNQILSNLIGNALEAYENSPLPRRPVLITLGKRATHLVLCVTDYGKGIPEDIGREIFTPFFTTKEYGIGLGLSTTKDIVEKTFRGTLTYHYGPQTGTVFTVRFPLPATA